MQILSNTVSNRHYLFSPTGHRVVVVVVVHRRKRKLDELNRNKFECSKDTSITGHCPLLLTSACYIYGGFLVAHRQPIADYCASTANTDDNRCLQANVYTYAMTGFEDCLAKCYRKSSSQYC